MSEVAEARARLTAALRTWNAEPEPDVEAPPSVGEVREIIDQVDAEKAAERDQARANAISDGLRAMLEDTLAERDAKRDAEARQRERTRRSVMSRSEKAAFVREHGGDAYMALPWD